MRTMHIAVVVILLMVGVWTIGNVRTLAQVESRDARVAVLDDCEPTDPTWADIGGCDILPNRGDVTRAEFGALVLSPLSASTVGHPSWRNEPSHLRVTAGRTVRVTNQGGRGHTFTKVAAFGGGFIPILNVGLVPAPECVAGPPPPVLPPGETEQAAGLTPGLNRYQCCIHPWMRATIRVE